MSFQKELKNDIIIYRIDNERLDTSLAPEFKTELLLVVNQGSKKVLIDLSKVKYADSSGLGALLFGLRQLRDIHGKLIICGANSRVINLLRIAKLEEILVNYTNETEAIDSLT
jgi:anti-sigma B factor antagonist